jgi:Periplasmic binding protein
MIRPAGPVAEEDQVTGQNVASTLLTERARSGRPGPRHEGRGRGRALTGGPGIHFEVRVAGDRSSRCFRGALWSADSRASTLRAPSSRGEIRQPGRNPGNGQLPRWTGVGPAAQHQHVRLGQRKRRSEVPVNTGIGKFLVAHGGNIVGSYGYSISPSSSRAAIGTVQSVIHAGGKQGVLDTSVPFGGSDFTTPALVAKSKNVNGLFGAMDDNSNFALATALKQAGVKLKAVVFPTGYEPAAITSPAWRDRQGDYFSSLFRPFQLPNAATTQMQAALQKYDSCGKTQFPTFEQYEAWVGADSMIKGMQLAGKNPTSSGVITALRSVKSYDANGLLANPINFSTIFGHDPAKSCGWYLQAQSKGFVPVSSQPVCGTDIPGTATASSN